MAHFEIRDLSFTYAGSNEAALYNINLDIKEGEFLLICGTSGCGKSTLLRHLKTCLSPNGKKQGEVLMDKKPLETYSTLTQAKRIGFCMQVPDDQIVTDKVWHEMVFGLENIGVEQSRMRVSAGEMASYFGIQKWFYKNTSELSGGQKQLLNLASILVMNPDTLILDEPTSQLDPIAAYDFLNQLKRINSELGITVILTEHRLEETMSLCDRVAVMDKGMIVMCDTPQNVAGNIGRTSEIYHAMPSSVRIFRETQGKGICPLTVRDGRRYLSELNIKPCEIDVKIKNPCDRTPVLEMKDCYFRYDKKSEDVLKGTEIKIYPGNIYGIVGGNGTGKSTMLKVLSGVLKPYRGKVVRNGKVSALSQDPRSVFVKSTVCEDLHEITDDEELIEKTAQIMQTKELLPRHPYDMSGGEVQRAAIAKVLLTQPDIILLDEPTKGMDASFKKKFGEMLTEIKKEGKAIVIVSHDIEFCCEYSDICGLFFDGSIIAENVPQLFFSGNKFYTTAANRIAGDCIKYATLTREVAEKINERK